MKIRNRIKEYRVVRAGDLKPSPKNWRKHPQSQQNALRAILADVGYADALLAREVDGGLELIDGHLRAETTPDEEVPVLILDVNEKEAAKILATLDPLAGLAEADTDRLSALVAECDFDHPDIKAMLDGMGADTTPEVEPGGGDDIPDESRVKKRCEPGDLWVIDGKHRLLIGDCTDKESVEWLMGGEKIKLLFTSPPYAQQRDYTKKIDNWDALMEGAFSAPAGVLADGVQILVNLGLIHRDGEWIPYWSGWIDWMRQQRWRRFGWYVWDQGSGMIGDWNGRFAPSFEFVFHFNRRSVHPHKWVGKKPESVAIGRSTGMRRKDGTLRPKSSPEASLQPTKVPDSVIRVNRDSSHGTDHPAVYPVALAEHIQKCWDGPVYDPFLGSGTSIIAAHRTQRICYGCELEPKYGDIVLARCEAEGLGVEKMA